MEIREIGGFFEASLKDLSSAVVGEQTSESLPPLKPMDVLCDSGRSAINLVLRDISTRLKKSSTDMIAYVPSYACDSMLRPFIQAGISLEFYEVILGDDGLIKYRIDPLIVCDVFLACSYFGFEHTAMDASVEDFRDQGVMVIEDVTHRLLSKTDWSFSHYHIASLRKWVAISTGGFARSCFGLLDAEMEPAGDAAGLGWRAMNLKLQYLKGQSLPNLKSLFLNLSKQQTQILRDEGIPRQMDRASQVYFCREVNFDKVAEARRSNARRLHSFLSEESFETLQYWDLGPNDTPLFMPIFIAPGARSHLVDYLRRSRVYAPVHWPVPTSLPTSLSNSSPYVSEVSLPCDQRYDEGDMQRIAATVLRFMRNVN